MDNEERIIELLTEIRDSLRKPEPKKQGKKFIKPTYLMVAAYCIEKKNGVDAAAFIAHYDSNGWKVGKNPMKNWKAALTTWSKRNGSERQGQNTGFDTRSRAKKVSDKLDEIAREDIERNGFASELDSGTV